MEKKVLIALVSAFGLSIVINFLNSMKIKNQERKLKKLDKKAMTPNQLISIMSSNPQKLNPTSLGEGQYLLKNISLKGILSSKQPLISSNEKDKLLFKTYIRSPLFSNSFLFKGTMNKQTRNTLNTHKFFNESSSAIELFDPTEEIGRKISCLIERDCIKNMYKFCKVTDERIHRFTNEISFFDKVIAFFQFTFEYVVFFFTSNILIPGIVIGYKDAELGLRCENTFIVLGDVVYNMHQNKFYINTMCNLISPFEGKNGKILSSIGLHKKIGHFLIFLTCFFGAASLLAFKIYKNKRILEKSPEKRHNIEKRIKNVDPEGLCIICCEHQRSIIFNPCLHLCVCSTCSPKIKNNKCPVCRELIQNKKEILVEEKFKEKLN